MSVHGESVASALPVIVGVDGSAASTGALQWAVRHAARDSLPVTAAFVIVGDSDGSVGRAGCAISDEMSLFQAASDELARAIRRAVGEPACEAVTAVVVSRPNAAQGLRELSARASCLLLGTSRAADDAAVLGTTAADLFRHAACPIVVIPLDVAQAGPAAAVLDLMLV